MSDLDELGRRLAGLRRDIEPLTLRDANAVRRRGDQRSRRQVAAATVGAFAVIGAVAFGARQGVSPRAADLPAPASTPTPSRTTAPDATTTPSPAPDPRPFKPSVLLPLAELPKLQPYVWTAAPVLTTVTPEGEGAQSYPVCRTPLADLPQPQQVLLGRHPSDLDAEMWQALLDYADAAQAQAAYDTLVAGCTDTTPLTGLPEPATGVLSTTFSAPADSEYNGNFRGVVRNDRTLTVLALGGMFRPGDVDLDTFQAATVAAAERVDAVLDGR